MFVISREREEMQIFVVNQVTCLYNFYYTKIFP